MPNKIIVQIYGDFDALVAIGCTSKANGCSSCGSHGNNNSDKNSAHKGCEGCGTNGKSIESIEKMPLNTIGKAYGDLITFIKKSDVSDSTEFEFIDITKTKLDEDSDIKSLLDRGFESPITVIDGIVRYYGGMSQTSVYKDIKELLS